jgi:Mn2+/Fe2+ NRAMP family transporter
MHVYILYLSVMCLLFCVSAGLLFLVALGQAARRKLERAAVYLGLTLLSSIVAAGFYFFRRLL